jgi:hypothetical protein
MAKRPTGVGKYKYRKSHSHKTKKRLEIKRLMLEARAKKESINKISNKILNSAPF